jgi:hypothetical protein
MAQRKEATKVEKEIIANLAFAFVLEDIGKKCFSEHEKSFSEFMAKKYRKSFRLKTELEAAIPRVYKQLKKDFEEHQTKEL